MSGIKPLELKFAESLCINTSSAHFQESVLPILRQYLYQLPNGYDLCVIESGPDKNCPLFFNRSTSMASLKHPLEKELLSVVDDLLDQWESNTYDDVINLTEIDSCRNSFSKEVTPVKSSNSLFGEMDPLQKKKAPSPCIDGLLHTTPNIANLPTISSPSLLGMSPTGKGSRSASFDDVALRTWSQMRVFSSAEEADLECKEAIKCIREIFKMYSPDNLLSSPTASRNAIPSSQSNKSELLKLIYAPSYLYESIRSRYDPSRREYSLESCSSVLVSLYFSREYERVLAGGLDSALTLDTKNKSSLPPVFSNSINFRSRMRNII